MLFFLVLAGGGFSLFPLIQLPRKSEGKIKEFSIKLTDVSINSTSEEVRSNTAFHPDNFTASFH